MMISFLPLLFELLLIAPTDSHMRTCGGVISDSIPIPIAHVRPAAASTTNNRENFVPFKILYIIDKSVNPENKAKLEKSLAVVREKLAGIIKAPRLDDIRLSRIPKPDNKSCEAPKCGREYDVEGALAFHCNIEPYVPEPGIDIKPNAEVEKMNGEQYSLVIFVDVKGDDKNLKTTNCEQKETIAYARFCRTDNDTLRPTHGLLIFCQAPVDVDKDEGRLRSVILHETLHVVLPNLVGSLDPKHKCNDSSYDLTAWAHNCHGKTWQAMDQSWTDSKGTSGTRKRFVSMLPGVIHASKKHFNCNQADGAELSFKTNPTTGEIEPDFLHWNLRLFAFDILAPGVFPQQNLSIITLSAIASHEGWYKVDMNKAEEIISKPHDLKCDILSKSCHEIIKESKSNKSIVPYCDSNNANPPRSLCSSDQRLHLSCFTASYTDNCPILLTSYPVTTDAYDSSSCLNATKNSKFGNNVGGTIGADSICVTFALFPYEKANSQIMPLCVKYECLPSSILITLHPNDKTKKCTMECPSEKTKQLVEFKMPKKCIKNYEKENLKIICPNDELLCDVPGGKEKMFSLSVGFILFRSLITFIMHSFFY